MWIGVVSLFPDMFAAVTEHGITGRAVKTGLVEFNCWNPRNFTTDRHRTVDDRPYGGGPGMVMMAEPLMAAVNAAQASAGEAAPLGTKAKVVYLTPQGEPLTQARLPALMSDKMILVAGRYEGVDQRFIDNCVDEEWSIGDYVLSGGELPAMVLLDAMIRQLPGALGDEQSAVNDSFDGGMLEYPHYTRPESLSGVGEERVPEVLLSGNHQAIEQWRRQMSLKRTLIVRPECLLRATLTKEDLRLLEELAETMPDDQQERWREIKSRINCP